MMAIGQTSRGSIWSLENIAALDGTDCNGWGLSTAVRYTWRSALHKLLRKELAQLLCNDPNAGRSPTPKNHWRENVQSTKKRGGWEGPASVTLLPPQILSEITQDWTQDSAMRRVYMALKVKHDKSTKIFLQDKQQRDPPLQYRSSLCNRYQNILSVLPEFPPHSSYWQP